MNTLLPLQELDLRIESCRARELEIPKQKGKFEVQRTRLAAELEEREKGLKSLHLEQRECESDIVQRQGQIGKYEQQLLAVKKNEEYQALLHEIDQLKKQIGLKEERIITLLVEIDGAKERLAEDRRRIEAEMKELDGQCAAVDRELAEAVARRHVLEKERLPLEEKVERSLLSRYNRIRVSKKTGAAVVPLNGSTCVGCNMTITPQIVNEIMAGKVHTCAHCGRLLFHKDNFPQESVQTA